MLAPLLGLALFTLALWVLHRELQTYHLREVFREFGRIPTRQLAAALLLTLASYGIMTGYDVLALRFIGHPLTYGKIALASFVGYAFSNNIGLSMLAGASVRYRLYTAWGLSGLEITKIVFFCTFTLWLGFFLLSGLVFTLGAPALPQGIHLPFLSARPLGVLFLALVGSYLAANFVWKRPLKLGSWELRFPSIRILGLQLLIACADWILAGGVLYTLLPKTPGLSFPVSLAMYMVAQLVGLLSQVPGGLGVFETTFLLLVSPVVPTPEALGSLLAFRLLYYLMPLGIAAGLLGAHEIASKRNLARQVVEVYQRWSPALLAPVLSFATFATGSMLLFSGATPALDVRLLWLKRFVPLPFLEISHFLGSLIGTGLLLLARGLQRRLDGAYWVTIILLAAGMIVSLVKGLDYEEAAILALVLTVLLPSHRYFYRKTALLSGRFTPAWLAAIAMVVVCSTWLGFLSYKHVDYRHDLWWQFAIADEVPRFLRASAGAVMLLLFFAVARLMRPAPPRPVAPVETDLNAVRAIVQDSQSSVANLALLGDKSFLFNRLRTAFIMFAVEGRSWVSMGDPVGPESEWSELIWRFREMSDRYGGRAVFYEVGPEDLHYYLDLGLTLTKLGESARVPLKDFSLEGGARKELRHNYRKLEKEGVRFQVLPKEEVPAAFPAFKEISDAWLANKNTREKGFSLGFFDPEYLRYFPAAVVRKEDDIVAFSNIWQSGGQEEVTVDLMRYHPEKAPRGVMDYLFVQAMLWGKEQGYRWFDLGMAPLTGLGGHVLDPLWNRLASFVSRHGEHFYSFQGLRQYKNKFDPVWEPKYLASPGGLALPQVLTNLAALVSGGLKGTVIK